MLDTATKAATTERRRWPLVVSAFLMAVWLLFLAALAVTA